MIADLGAADERKDDSFFRPLSAGILAFWALVATVALLLVPLGTTYDSDCGTLLQHPYPIQTCQDRAHTRLLLIAGAGVVVLALTILSIRWSRNRTRTFVIAIGLGALTFAGIVVGAPYGERATTTAAITFTLHCPGRFSDFGGQEHPPPGTEHVCNDADNRRAGLAIGAIAAAVVVGTALLVRDRKRSTV